MKRVLISLMLSVLAFVSVQALADGLTVQASGEAPLAAVTAADAPAPDVLVELPGVPFPLPSGVAGWITFMASVGLAFTAVCRALSELLLLIAKKTKTDADDKAQELLARVATMGASFFGHFGAGTPKAIVAAKAVKMGVLADDGDGKDIASKSA
jgi:hypothetical protein